MVEGSLSEPESVTERIVSLTIGNCLQCQFKPSPWKRDGLRCSPKPPPTKKVAAAASVYVGFSGLMQYERTLNLVLQGQKTKLEKQSSTDSALGEVGL